MASHTPHKTTFGIRSEDELMMRTMKARGLLEKGLTCPSPSLVFLSDKGEVLHFPTHKRLEIGKLKHPVFATDNYMSGKHFVIFESVLEALRTTNGTRVNNRLITGVHFLKHGDIIQAGSHVFVFKDNTQLNLWK